MIKFNELEKLNQLKINLIKNEVTQYLLSDNAAWMETELFNKIYNQTIDDQMYIVCQLAELVGNSLEEYYLLIDFILADKAAVQTLLSTANLSTDTQSVHNIIDNLDNHLHCLIDLSELK
jgi:hypothetical protein